MAKNPLARKPANKPIKRPEESLIPTYNRSKHGNMTKWLEHLRYGQLPPVSPKKKMKKK